jgi:hypothetical protein
MNLSLSISLSIKNVIFNVLNAKMNLIIVKYVWDNIEKLLYVIVRHILFLMDLIIQTVYLEVVQMDNINLD